MNRNKRRARLVPGDWIHLRQVKVRCVLGVYPAERRQLRQVRMDLSLECDRRGAAESDCLKDTLDYEVIEAEAMAIAKQGSYYLLETLAERVAAACLKHPRVRGVRVVVDKPGALASTRSVAVEIQRRK